MTENDPRDDPALLAAVRAGDRAAIEILLTRHEASIYRFGLRMCGNEDDAKEILQETLVAAFRNLASFRGDARLSTWLYQIARSFCIKARRGPPRPSSLDAAMVDTASTEPGPEQAAHARQIGEAMAIAIRGLPAEHREALVLRDVEGLSAEEAAAVAGVEVGALKSRLHRARMQLRCDLANLLGETALGPAPCPELAAELSAYAAQEIDQAACVQLEAHLAACPRCAGACEALKTTLSLCRRLPEGDVPAPVRAAVRRAIFALAVP